MNEKYIVVVDLETTGLDPSCHDIIEMCAWAYDPRSLAVVPADSGGEFYSKMRPGRPENVSLDALEANKLKLEDIMSWPDPKAVWPQFVRWLKRYNKECNEYTAPLAAGKNVAFDLAFIREANKKYGKGAVLFSRGPVIELELLLFAWFEDDPEFSGMSLDYCRQYFGLPSQGAHRARMDVEQTGLLLAHFLETHRLLRRAKGKNGRPLVSFKGAFKNDE